jgi:hypothetical protein
MKGLIIVSILLLSQSVFAQNQNYSGIWILNNEKTKLQARPDGMTSSVFIIKQSGRNFSLTIHHVFGAIQDTVLLNMISDGKTRKVLGSFNGKLEQKENYLQITIWDKNFLDKVQYKFGSNKDEFIADEVLKSDSDNHHNVWVFDRQISK